MDITITIIVGLAGLLLGVGVSFGTIRGKLAAIEKGQEALGVQLGKVFDRQGKVDTVQARHDERIGTLESDVREIRNRFPTSPGMVPVERS